MKLQRTKLCFASLRKVETLVSNLYDIKLNLPFFSLTAYLFLCRTEVQKSSSLIACAKSEHHQNQNTLCQSNFTGSFIIQIFKMDWTACILCQEKSKENLQCPKTHNAMTVHAHFLKNVEEFRKHDKLPVQLVWGSEITAAVLNEHGASWHHSCHLKLRRLKLRR